MSAPQNNPKRKIVRGYKTELDPTDKQLSAILNHAGAARWAYNWGLRRKIESYKATGKSPSAMDLHKELVLLKKIPKEEGGASWLNEVSKCAPQLALQHLDDAYIGFFRRCKQKDLKRKGFPKFKSRKGSINKFTLTGHIHVSTTHIQLPRLGKIRLKEHDYLPTDETDPHILRATVAERAGRCFVSIQIEEEIEVKKAPEYVLGVDVGVKSLAVTSDGQIFENPKALRKSEQRLRLLQKSVSRKVKGSSNRKKAVAKVARQHYRVACVRKDAIHKATHAIAKQASTVVIETLNVKGMMRNHCLAQAVGDASLGEFHRQLEYKVKWRGGTIVKADRFYSSSKTCSKCGVINQTLTLADRVFECPSCGYLIDRDLNAALNLRALAVSSTVTACCPGSSGRNHADETSGWAGTKHHLNPISGIDG